jgi:alanyl-tRNA synthetase
VARRELEEAVAGYRARELHASIPPDARGRRVAVVREPAGPVERVRALALAYAGLAGGVLIAVVGEPPAVLLATAADTGLDAGRILKPALEASGGRGGGNVWMAQGSVREVAALEGVVEAVLRAVSAAAYSPPGALGPPI